MNPYRAPAYLTVDGFRVIVRQGCIAVSLAVLMLAGAASPGRSQPTASGENPTVAAEASAHWLIGLWEGSLQGTPSTPGPRFIHVTAVAADGTAQGLWGVSDDLPSKAQINVQTSRVHIINAAKSVTELTREGEDRLVGTLTSSGGKIFLVIFVRQTPKREQEYLGSFKNDLTNMLGTWKGKFSPTGVHSTDPKGEFTLVITAQRGTSSLVGSWSGRFMNSAQGEWNDWKFVATLTGNEITWSRKDGAWGRWTVQGEELRGFTSFPWGGMWFQSLQP